MNLEKLATIAQHNQLAFQHGDRPKLTLCTGRPIAFVEAFGQTVPDVCKELEIASQTYYRWRQKYGGMAPEPYSCPTFQLPSQDVSRSDPCSDSSVT